MISNPYEDITKACEDAELNASTKQMDFAVIMRRCTKPENNRYHIIGVVLLDDATMHLIAAGHQYIGWQLMAIAKPSGLVYTWQPVPGYNEEMQL